MADGDRSGRDGHIIEGQPHSADCLYCRFGNTVRHWCVAGDWAAGTDQDCDAEREARAS